MLDGQRLRRVERIAKTTFIVEWMRKAVAIMARTEYGDVARVFRYLVECDMSSDIHARFSRTGKLRALSDFTE